jgi:predicted N-acetyltransferase YhbS
LTVVNSTIYRQIEPFETAAVAALAREVFDQFVAPHYQPDGVSEFHRYSSADALSQRHESDHVTLVAEHSGELVGMLHLRKPRHVAMLFVRSSFQHKGIGRKLLAAAAALVNDSDCEFTVNSSPNAVLAYEHLGFHAVGDEQCVHGIRFIPMRKQRRSTRRVITHDA